LYLVSVSKVSSIELGTPDVANQIGTIRNLEQCGLYLRGCYDIIIPIQKCSKIREIQSEIVLYSVAAEAKVKRKEDILISYT